jgi:hypothetical protein
MWPLYLGGRSSLRSQSCTKGGSDVLQVGVAPLGPDVLTNHASVRGYSVVGDLSGGLFLFLIEKETVEETAEENRISA